MKTSHPRARECKPFTYGFMIFRIREHMDIRLQRHTSYIQAWASNIINKEKAPLQQVRHQHESVGKWRRRNERIGR